MFPFTTHGYKIAYNKTKSNQDFHGQQLFSPVYESLEHKTL